MGKEIERKFLIAGTVPYDGKPVKFIQQGYIVTSKNKQVRVRIINNKSAFICIKFTDKLVRDEYEYEIPLKDGLELFDKCKLKLNKKRYSMTKPNHIDIDIYDDGLVVVEVEFESEEEANKFEPLRWMGAEVTGNKEYSNITIAKKLLTK